MLKDLVLFGTLAIGLLPDSVFSQEQVAAANATELPPAKTAKVLLHVKSDRDLPVAMQSFDSESATGNKSLDATGWVKKIDVLANETDNEIIEMRQVGCPPMSDLPIMDHEDKVFYGARVWSYEGGPIASLACNPKHVYDIKAGTKLSIDQGLADKIGGFGFGTLYVHKGCTVYFFEKCGYQGMMRKYTAGYYYNGPLLKRRNLAQLVCERYTILAYFPEVCLGPPYSPSFTVECNMSVPKCVPSDGWATVETLINQGSTADEMEYKKTVGTSWSHEFTKEFEHSTSVTAAVKANFFDTFSAEVSTTFTTGYSWKHVNSQSKSDTTTFTISTNVPAGTITTILQATGYCGGSEVKTEMFKNINKPIDLPYQCSSKIYRTLNETTRTISYTETNGRKFKSDVFTHLFDPSPSWQGPGWYKFAYPAGKYMATSPPPKHRCGTVSPGWMVEPHPTEAGITKQVKFCFVWNGDSCWRSSYGKVTNCGAGDFVYYLTEPCKACKARYCGAPTITTV